MSLETNSVALKFRQVQQDVVRIFNKFCNMLQLLAAIDFSVDLFSWIHKLGDLFHQVIRRWNLVRLVHNNGLKMELSHLQSVVCVHWFGLSQEVVKAIIDY